MSIEDISAILESSLDDLKDDLSAASLLRRLQQMKDRELAATIKSIEDKYSKLIERATCQLASDNIATEVAMPAGNFDQSIDEFEKSTTVVCELLENIMMKLMNLNRNREELLVKEFTLNFVSSMISKITGEISSRQILMKEINYIDLAQKSDAAADMTFNIITDESISPSDDAAGYKSEDDIDTENESKCMKSSKNYEMIEGSDSGSSFRSNPCLLESPSLSSVEAGFAEIVTDFSFDSIDLTSLSFDVRPKDDFDKSGIALICHPASPTVTEEAQIFDSRAEEVDRVKRKSILLSKKILDSVLNSFELIQDEKIKQMQRKKQDIINKETRKLALKRVREREEALINEKKLEEEELKRKLDERCARLKMKVVARKERELLEAKEKEKKKLDLLKSRPNTTGVQNYNDNKVRLIPLTDDKLKARALKLLDRQPTQNFDKSMNIEDDKKDNSIVGAYLAQTSFDHSSLSNEKPSPSSSKLNNISSSNSSRSVSPAQKYGKNDVIWILRQDEDGIVRESKLMPLMATLNKDEEKRKKKKEMVVTLQEKGWNGPAGGTFVSSTLQKKANEKLRLSRLRAMGVPDPFNFTDNSAHSSTSQVNELKVNISLNASISSNLPSPTRLKSPNHSTKDTALSLTIPGNYVPKSSISKVQDVIKRIQKLEKKHRNGFGVVEERLMLSPFAEAFRQPKSK